MKFPIDVGHSVEAEAKADAAETPHRVGAWAVFSGARGRACVGLLSLVGVLGIAGLSGGCDDDGAAKTDAANAETPAAEPKRGMRMKNDGEVCKKAMECCVERVKAEHGSAEPDQVSLSCSGVAMASTDAECQQFAKGYAYVFESKKVPVPEVCQSS